MRPPPAAPGPRRTPFGTAPRGEAFGTDLKLADSSEA